MADFYQTGDVATLHRLGHANLRKMEEDLELFARRQHIALVLPCLFSEFSGPAIGRIIAELKQVRYLDQIVVTLGRTTAEQLPYAREFFSELPQPVKFVWNDGPRLQALYDLLREHDLPVGEDGKGRSCWMAHGYLLGNGPCDVIALHDCDITTYSRELLARLCYPVANPNLDFEFAKGFYARVSTKMHGRVTRLFVTPLLRSLRAIFGPLPLLSYLDSFRYPLSGEFAMKADLARVNRIPGDWGLEVGMLAEVYRNCSLKRICQTELCENYDHKHQALSAEDPGKGLLKMCIDIAKILFRMLASEGVVFSEGVFKTLLVRYIRAAQDTITRYHADAAINGLSFDRHEEEGAVAAFARGLQAASQQYLEDPLGGTLIPNWNRIVSAIPDFLERVHEAVEQDTAVAVPAGVF
jgi:glucosyl-3-phosphoglycerate synthase